MIENYTIKKSFDLSGDQITNSLSGVNYCIIANQHYEQLGSSVLGKITLLVHSCHSAFFMHWNDSNQCIREIDVIIKVIDEFVCIVKNNSSFKSRILNKTKKINNKYGIRLEYNPRANTASFSFIERKRVFQTRITKEIIRFKEKCLIELHSDSVYHFPIDNEHGKQSITESGLYGLCERLLNLQIALKDMRACVV